jgi:aminoglycoside phosphotransferase
MIGTRSLEEDLVFTHGDYCLPNIIVSSGRLSGFIDWGHGGVADRYPALTLATRSLRHSMGLQSSELVSLFFREYEIEDTDFRRIRYYILLDELS